MTAPEARSGGLDGNARGLVVLVVALVVGFLLLLNAGGGGSSTEVATGGDSGGPSTTAPLDGGVAFPAGGIAVVPLRVASGVRMKILEAWARGVPVVATPAAGAGLEPAGWVSALDPAQWVEGIRALSSEPAHRAAVVESGRRILASAHAPAVVAARLLALYGQVRTR